MATLGPAAAHIFRVTHVSNVPWILDHGLHAQSSPTSCPNFVSIGMPELIAKRATCRVPVWPGGFLSDYVPFYFTPHSIMMYNIRTGQHHLAQWPNEEIVVFVSSLHKLRAAGVPCVFTNGHAYLKESRYFNDLSNLNEIDWELLRRRDFKRDPEDPGKLGRYQAEALAYQHVPCGALTGMACYDSSVQHALRNQVAKRSLNLQVKVIRNWYF